MMREKQALVEGANSLGLLGSALLVPPLFWWFVLLLSLVGMKSAEMFLSRLHATGEILTLLVCPMLAVILNLIGMRQVKREDARGEALSWAAVLAGAVLAVGAVLASLRNS